ncbi:ABC transporter ATP-binding protein [Actinomyces bowdenii]|uniref:ABC transporter ATP-binding protein n=1 Tax=Actinomyces bowdenii TaxID=131109 RepID=A0A3P1V9E8_9ACTO|nr:ABC transporter ATP-binding protein [Actinomyces bowdenii]RRD30388.1 ABC transporter ATP-binding protein [Actinomyces bowdenii]
MSQPIQHPHQPPPGPGPDPRPGRSSEPPGPAVASPGGRRANAATLVLSALGALAGGWALISTGRALGALVIGRAAGPHLVTAVVAALIGAACQMGAQLVSRSSATREEAHLRRLTLTHLLALGPARTVEARSGSTVSLLTDGVERVALYRQTFLAPTAAAAVAPLLVLAELAVAADAVTALVLAAAIIIVPAAIALLHRRLRASSSQSRRARMRLAADYLDAIQGLSTLRISRAAERMAQRLRARGEENRRAIMRVLAGNQIVILVTDGLFSLCLITVAAGLALARMGQGAITVADALAIILTSYVLLEPLDHVGAFFYVGMGGMANQRALRRILARPLPGAPAASPAADPPVAVSPASAASPASAVSAVPSAHGPRPGSQSTGGGGAEDEVVLDGVWAAWDPQARPVLRGVDLRVRRGEHLAVVGASGAGKSTLLAMLAGDLIPSGGRAWVHGTELRPAAQERVRAASSLVAQSTWLFTGTIAENLRLASPEASTEQMWRALEEAGLAPEVRLMPQGLDTGVGEAGMGLSGGQAQRLSLARAVLADRPLLLLDEPTSQVDLASEAAIARALERLARGRTVITVSHRPGALVRADRTVRVVDGRLVEDGAPPSGQAPPGEDRPIDRSTQEVHP